MLILDFNSNKLMSVTYIEGHAKVVDASDEGILGKILHLAMEDFLLKIVLLLQLQFRLSHNFGTGGRQARPLLCDGFFSSAVGCSCGSSCHFHFNSKLN